MRNRKTYILLFIVICMGVAAFYLEKSENEKEASQYIRLPVQADQINTLTIQKSNEKLEFKKTSDGWFFVNNVKADTEYLNDLNQRIQNADFELVNLQPDQKTEQFRFEKPAAQITITDNLGRKHSLTLSERRNFSGEPYYKINNEEQIYTLNTDLDKKIMNKKIFFQDKHIFKNQHEEFNQIEIKSLNHSFDVLKIPNLERSHVLAFISKIKNLTVQDYILAASCKLSQPVMSVVMLSKALTWSLKMSLDPVDKKLYASAKIKDQGKMTEFCVEYDTSYWAYFSNLSEQQFVKDQK